MYAHIWRFPNVSRKRSTPKSSKSFHILVLKPMETWGYHLPPSHNGCFRIGTSAGVISRHFPELTPAAWHTAHARHERSPAIWNSYWHTDGQSGTLLKQTI